MTQEVKTALVTGAAVRVGRAIARGLAQRGYAMALHYHRHEAEALELERELRTRGSATAIPADLRDARAAETLIREAEEQVGPLTLLVLSAGTFFPSPLDRWRIEEVEESLTLNLVSQVNLARTAGVRMKQRGAGAIITLLDYTHERPRPGHLVYEVGKAGLRAATLALAQDLAPEVRVNGIALGAILPPDGASSETYGREARATLIGRHGTPEDVVAAVYYLAHAESFVTGTVLTVDGGRRLR